MIPISVIIATTLLGLISMVHHCIRSQGDMRNSLTDSSAMTVVTEVPGPAPKVVPLRGEETTRMLSMKQSAEASPDLNNFDLSKRINRVRPNQSAEVLFSMPSVFGPLHSPDPEQPGLKQQQLRAFVNDVCTCNHESVNLQVTYSQSGGTSRTFPVQAGVCSCQRRFFHSDGQNFRPILCHYQVQDALTPGSNTPTFGPIRPCLGKQFFYFGLQTSVGLYEYRAVQARAPATFQYAGPARYFAGDIEPIVSIFTIVICNELSRTPVNLVLTPPPNPGNSWTLLGQKPVYRGGDVCTSVDQRQMDQFASQGFKFYCNYVVNEVSASCGTSDSRLQPWTYDATSTVAALVYCSGAQVPVCSIVRMYDWLRWPVQQ